MQWLVFNHTMKSNFAMNDHLLPFSTAKKLTKYFMVLPIFKMKTPRFGSGEFGFFSANELLEYALKSFLKCSC